MAQHLSDMTIEEISLVDDPANEQARVLIVKAKKPAAKDQEPDGDEEGDEEEMNLRARRVYKALEEIAPDLVQAVADGNSANPDAAAQAAASLKEYTMDIETLSKALEDAEAKLEALETRASEAEAALNERDELVKSKDEELETMKKSLNTSNDENEDEILKSLPESIRKRLDDAKAVEEELAKSKAKAEQDQAIAKAKDIGVGNPEEVGALLLRVGKGMTTTEDAAMLETMLKSFSAVAGSSLLFKSIGSDDAEGAEPEEMLKAKASEIQKSNPSLTAAQAYDKALAENPELYNAYVSKRRTA